MFQNVPCMIMHHRRASSHKEDQQEVWKRHIPHTRGRAGPPARMTIRHADADYVESIHPAHEVSTAILTTRNGQAPTIYEYGTERFRLAPIWTAQGNCLMRPPCFLVLSPAPRLASRREPWT